MRLQRKRRKDKYDIIKNIGFILIAISILIGIAYNIYLYYLGIKEIEKIDKYYKNWENTIIDDSVDTSLNEEKETKEETPIIQEDYVAILEIPKIALQKGLFAKNSPFNNLNNSVQILKDSDNPEEENGNVLLAAHSGYGYNAYFKNLDKVIVNDEVYLTYYGYKYTYKVVNIYDIKKTGKAYIIKNKDKNTLTMITCRDNTNNQIVVISELQGKERLNEI